MKLLMLQISVFSIAEPGVHWSNKCKRKPFAVEATLTIKSSSVLSVPQDELPEEEDHILYSGHQTFSSFLGSVQFSVCSFRHSSESSSYD